MTDINLTVSIGEALDKLSILEIKLEKIQHENRKLEVQKEYDTILPSLKDIIESNKYNYKCLKVINTEMWNLSDKIRDIDTNNSVNYVKIYNKLLLKNEERFRIKHKINTLGQSTLKEQKGYAIKKITVLTNFSLSKYVEINGIIRYLTIKYDQVNLVHPEKMTSNLKSIFKNELNINFIPLANELVINAEKLDDKVLVNDTNIDKINLLDNNSKYKEICKICDIDSETAYDLSHIQNNYVSSDKFISSDIGKYMVVCDEVFDKVPDIDTDMYVFHPYKDYYRDDKDHKYYGKWTGVVSENIIDYTNLIENAEEVHMTVNSLFYMSQYLDLSKVKKKNLYHSKEVIIDTNIFNKNWNKIILDSTYCKNYVTGGKLGDLIHILYVIMTNYKTTKHKGNLYIDGNMRYGGDRFLTSVDVIYNELKNIISIQPYINKFEILKNNLPDNLINLNFWRNYTCKMSWLEMLSFAYKIPILTHKYLTVYNKKDDKFIGKILIHRSNHRHTSYFPWLEIVAKNKCTFVTCDQSEYNNFPFKNFVDVHLCSNLDEYVDALNSCEFFIGNQSSPLAIAYALHKPMLCELTPVDSIHYVRLEKYHSQMFWISHNSNNLDGVSKYINM